MGGTLNEHLHQLISSYVCVILGMCWLQKGIERTLQKRGQSTKPQAASTCLKKYLHSPMDAQELAMLRILDLHLLEASL